MIDPKVRIEDYLNHHPEIVSDLVKKDQEDIETFLDHLTSLCIDILDLATDDSLGEIEPEEFHNKHKVLVNTFDRGHRLWLEVVSYIRDKYKIEFSQLNFIYIMKYIETEKLIPEKFIDTWGYALRDVFGRIYYDMKDAHKDAVDMKELGDKVTNAKMSTLKDFIDTFKEIKYYHPEEDQYYSEHKIELHHHLAKLYREIFFQ